MSNTQLERNAAEVPTFGEAATAAADALRLARRKASAAINELGGEAYETGARAREQVSDHVKSQPLMSVLVAAGVGLLAGLLWPRH